MLFRHNFKGGFSVTLRYTTKIHESHSKVIHRSQEDAGAEPELLINMSFLEASETAMPFLLGSEDTYEIILPIDKVEEATTSGVNVFCDLSQLTYYSFLKDLKMADKDDNVVNIVSFVVEEDKIVLDSPLLEENLPFQFCIDCHTPQIDYSLICGDYVDISLTARKIKK